MTPKEKAMELAEKFPYSMKESKYCALIAVDEILAEYNRMNKYNFVIEKEYWLKVKQEIENL